MLSAEKARFLARLHAVDEGLVDAFYDYQGALAAVHAMLGVGVAAHRAEHDELSGDPTE